MSESRRLVGLHLAAALFYLLISLVVTYPLALRLGSEMLGPHYADRMQNVWNLWWTGASLRDRHASPFHTDMLFYPQGADLYFHTLDLPLTLLAVLPASALGLVFGYNFSVLFAIIFAGYAGWRLVYYLTRSPAAALVGGLIIGFNPLTQSLVQGQINAVNLGPCLLCIEFYLRAWDTISRRDAILTGLFFALSVLTVGYYEGYLLLFFAAHLLFRGWGIGGGGRERAVERQYASTTQALRILVWAGGTALLLAGPYLLAAWLSLRSGQVVAYSPTDLEKTTSNSADLLSFILPNRDGWLLGGLAPWWRGVNPAIYDFTFLGPITLVLAAIGFWFQKRLRPWLWLAMAAVGVVLALGPVLQVNGSRIVGGVEVPLPFALLRLVPPFDIMRVPFRFSTMAWIGLGVLAGMGAARLLAGRGVRLRTAVLTLVIGLLLLEMPLHVRDTRLLDVPMSLQAVARDPAPGALLELPFTQHGGADAARMLYQTAHSRPITGGYLSRSIIPPDREACSPFGAFSRYPDIEAEDIITPTASGQLPQILAENGISFLAVYKSRTADITNNDPLPADQLIGLQALAARLGTPLTDDGTATTYRVLPATGPSRTFLQLGDGWDGLERSAGTPFRWIDGAQAEMCVLSPRAAHGALTMRVTSFGMARRLQVRLGETQLFEASVPADGALHTLTTPAFDWPAGAQLVRLTVPEGSASPASLGQGTDTRQLSLGFAGIAWEGTGP